MSANSSAPVLLEITTDGRVLVETNAEGFRELDVFAKITHHNKNGSSITWSFRFGIKPAQAKRVNVDPPSMYNTNMDATLLAALRTIYINGFVPESELDWNTKPSMWRGPTGFDPRSDVRQRTDLGSKSAAKIAAAKRKSGLVKPRSRLLKWFFFPRVMKLDPIFQVQVKELDVFRVITDCNDEIMQQMCDALKMPSYSAKQAIDDRATARTLAAQATVLHPNTHQQPSAGLVAQPIAAAPLPAQPTISAPLQAGAAHQAGVSLPLQLLVTAVAPVVQTATSMPPRAVADQHTQESSQQEPAQPNA